MALTARKTGTIQVLGTIVVVLQALIVNLVLAAPAGAAGTCVFTADLPIVINPSPGQVFVEGKAHAVCDRNMDTITVNAKMFAGRGAEDPGVLKGSAINICGDDNHCHATVDVFAQGAGVVWSWHTHADGSWVEMGETKKNPGTNDISTCLNNNLKPA